MYAISHLFLFVSVSLVFNYCFNIIHSTQLQPSFDFLSRILQQMLHDSGKYLNKLGFNFINVMKFTLCGKSPNTEFSRSVFYRIWSEYGKYRPEKTPYLDTQEQCYDWKRRLTEEYVSLITWFTCISSSKHLRSMFQLEAVTGRCSVQKVLW